MMKTAPLSLLRDALIANHTVAAEDRSLLLPNKSQLSIDTPTGRNQQLTLSHSLSLEAAGRREVLHSGRTVVLYET